MWRPPSEDLCGASEGGGEQEPLQLIKFAAIYPLFRSGLSPLGTAGGSFAEFRVWGQVRPASI